MRANLVYWALGLIFCAPFMVLLIVDKTTEPAYVTLSGMGVLVGGFFMLKAVESRRQ